LFNLFYLVPVDGKKTKKPVVHVHNSDEEEENAQTENQKDKDYKPENDDDSESSEGSDSTSDEYSESEASGDEDAENEVEVIKEKKKSKGKQPEKPKKRKIILEKREEQPHKKRKTNPNHHQVAPEPQPTQSTSAASDAGNNEKTFDNKMLVEKTEKKSGKKQAPQFNDRNVDYNLFSSDNSNVIQRKIKISNNLIVTCRLLEADTRVGLNYEYAALIFQRKSKDDKAFEFNLPLNVTPSLIEALNLIMKDNPKYFSKH